MGINEFINDAGSEKLDQINVRSPTRTKKSHKLNDVKNKYKPTNSAIEAGYNGFLSIFVISSSRKILHSSRNSKDLYVRNVIQFDGKGNLELKNHRANDTLKLYLKQIEEEGYKANAPIVWTNKKSQKKHSCSLIPVETSSYSHTPTDERRKSNAPFACLVFEELGLDVQLCSLELQENFALTKAEIDLAEGLFAGKDICQIADENGITKNTIRERLKNVFLKTGTNRQAALVRMLRLFAK